MVLDHSGLDTIPLSTNSLSDVMPDDTVVSHSHSHVPEGVHRWPSGFVIKSFFAGGIAGMCAKSFTAPLDRLKILLQVQHKQYRAYGVFSGFVAIYKKEGIFGYYKGNAAMMARIFPYAAIQFMSYEQYKRLVRPYFNQNTHTSKLLAGSLTGITAVTFTYPLDMVRARMAFQVHERKYASIIHTLTSIPKQEGGFIALYRGFSSTILGMIPYAGVAFYSYEVTKSFLMRTFPAWTTKSAVDGSGTVVLNIPANLIAGGMAGAISQTVSYPLDVSRRHMQLAGMISDHSRPLGVFATLSRVYRTSGLRGLYRGMTINFYRSVPQVAVSFSVYELLKQILGISKPL